MNTWGNAIGGAPPAFSVLARATPHLNRGPLDTAYMAISDVPQADRAGCAVADRLPVTDPLQERLQGRL